MAIDYEDLKRKYDIVTVVGHYMPLRKSGEHYVGLCPFHGENTPSFYVTSSKGIAHCYGCNTTYDVVDFVENFLRISRAEAVAVITGVTQWKPRTSVPVAPKIPERITSKPPPDAPVPSMGFNNIGEPTSVFALKDVDGSLIAYEARYTDAKFKSLMWTWGARGDRKPRWDCGAMNEPRPLYGLHRLGEMPDAPVLITEGPKKADAAARLFLARYASLSLTGGIGAVMKHDYAPIAGKEVLLWPDADSQRCKTIKDARKFGCAVGELVPYPYQPGQAGMFLLAAHLVTLGCKVRIVHVEGMPNGWDVADAEVEGWSSETAIAWAKKRINDYPGCPGLNGHVILNPDGSFSKGQNVPLALPDDEDAPDPNSQEALLARANFVMADQVKPEPIRWLWKDRIALGKITLLVGNPGLGKSQTCASITSIVTTGGLWPNDRSRCEKGSVIILSSEDDPGDTVRPRLDAAGADVTKVCLLGSMNEETIDHTPRERAFSVADDLAVLGAIMDKLGDVRLLIIDPISAYMGSADSYKDSEVRGLLTPLSMMAYERKVAVILISHMTKSQGSSALMRVQGSVALVALARAVWGINEDPEDETRRLFVSMKNNIGKGNTGLAFTIQSCEVPSDYGPVETSRVMWQDEVVTVTADEVMNSTAASMEEREESRDAASFLRSLLYDGPVPSTVVMKEAKGAGYSDQAMYRAKKKVKAETGKSGGQAGAWVWYLKGQGKPPRNAYAERED